MRSIKTISTLLLALVISGCGFHLRGQMELPNELSPLFLASQDKQSDFTRHLLRSLNSSGIALADSQGESNTILYLSELDSSVRTVSLGSQAYASEYLMSESVTMEVRDREGKTLLGPRTLSERRVMTNDPNNRIDKNNEQSLIRSELTRNLADKVVRQLRGLKP